MSKPESAEWTVREMAGGVDVLDGQGEMVCLMNTGKIESDREAAELIVRSVNALPAMIGAAELFLTSLRAGTRDITEQGVRSAAFASRADETAAALRDLKEIVAIAKGGAS